MSLIKLPLRVVTVKALTGLTYAGPAVFDSAIVPLEAKLADEQGVPLLVVYTDDSHAHAHNVNAHDMAGFHPRINLTVHAAVATQISTTASGQAVVIARADEGLEATLDIIEAQVLRVLQYGQGAWSNLWRTLALNVEDLHVRRGASARKGLRFAAREMVMSIKSHSDPLGEGLEYPWNDVIAAFQADQDLDGLAAVLSDFCTSQSTAPQWQKDLNVMGLDKASASALGFATADGEDVVFS